MKERLTQLTLPPHNKGSNEIPHPHHGRLPPTPHWQLLPIPRCDKVLGPEHFTGVPHYAMSLILLLKVENRYGALSSHE